MAHEEPRPSNPKYEGQWIWVEAYYRLRHGALESVQGHFRKRPKRRKSATVITLPFPPRPERD